jgi:hypothetical protein
MTRRRIGTTAAPLLVLVLALAGCSGEGKAGGKDEEEVSPLGKFFEQAYGDFDEDQGNRDMLRVEETVAECMAEQGFDYTPMDPTTQGGMSFSSEDLDVEWGSREFAEQYGYGITTDPFAELQGSQPEPEPEEYVDPNAEYIESMSESEQQAYFEALHGNQEMPEDPEGEYEYDWEQNGCYGKAQHEVYEIGMDDPAITSLEEEMNALWEQTQQDPRVTKATTSWINCMGDAGYTGLAAVEDAHNQISEKSNAIYENAYPSDMGEEMPSEEDIAAIESAIQAKLAGVKEEEIATAVADWECRDEIGFDDTMKEVSFELEQEFVDTHREELEAWVEAVAAQNS